MWFESGEPEIYIERHENSDGGRWFTAKIKSIPEAYHVQWKVKRNGHEEFSLIDVNDPKYKGTANSLSFPVLVVKKKELLENQSFHIKVDNFIGSSIKEIFGKKNIFVFFLGIVIGVPVYICPFSFLWIKFLDLKNFCYPWVSL